MFAPVLVRLRLLVLPELRVRIEPRRFRVIDLAVYRGSWPEGRYATQPAFAAIEIVSPDDRYGRLTHRLEDYRRWGVPHVWLVDPELKRLYRILGSRFAAGMPGPSAARIRFRNLRARTLQRRIAHDLHSWEFISPSVFDS